MLFIHVLPVSENLLDAGGETAVLVNVNKDFVNESCYLLTQIGKGLSYISVKKKKKHCYSKVHNRDFA